MATAARTTIAQVTEVVPVGTLDPEAVVTPSIFVDRIVQVEARQLHRAGSPLMSEPAIEHTAIENTGRGPLSTDELAAVIGHDIPAGSYVNLGIGQPTKIADYLPTDEDGNQTVILHTENGMLGMGPTAAGDADRP